jgi:uncharacterized protein (DUF433 family)
MSTVMSLRVQDAAAKHIQKIAQQERRSLSEIGARAIEEWLQMQTFPYIEFRGFHGERQACIKERIQVWHLIQIAQGYGMDVQKTCEHLLLRPEQVQNAFDYYICHTEEIDELIARNSAGIDTLRQLFPNIKVIEIKTNKADKKDKAT